LWSSSFSSSSLLWLLLVVVVVLLLMLGDWDRFRAEQSFGVQCKSKADR
jgi:hypothetical protein